SRGKSRVVAGASVAVGVCILWLLIGAVGNNALGGESDVRTQAFVATENGHKVAQERGREKVEILAGRLHLAEPLDAPQGKAAQAPQSAPAREQDQALGHARDWDRAEALARALTSSLQGELDAARSAAK